ncbi:DUF4878 domain-containing protein [Priestia megaterium]|nr:DUF4878 domain-containing protein [Priestia megaterium]
MEINYCGSCGHKVVSGGRFCVHCGSKLSSDRTENKEENNTVAHANSEHKRPDQATIKQASKKKRLMWLGAFVAFIVIVMFVRENGFGKESPAAVAEEFITHTKNSDWDQAAELVFDESMISYQMMSNLTHRYYLDGMSAEVDEYKVIREEINGDKAVVDFKLIFDDGKREEVRFLMMKDDKKWKVYRY